MANKKTFGAARPAVSVPLADTNNLAGGKAYSLSAEEALAQLAATGTFNATYYGTGADQVTEIKRAADQVSPLFLAQCALYARQKAFMKDMPAALLVMLTRADSALADLIFDRVVDNGKQLRNYVQMTSSGALGRNGFSGSTPKRLVARWLNKQTPESLLRASVGNDPTLAQVIRLAHPKPADKIRANLYAYLRGCAEQTGDGPTLLEERVQVGDQTKIRRTPRWRLADLPALFQQLELFKKGQLAEVPDVDFRFLAGLPLTKTQWAQVAIKGRFVQTFKNLNTYLRHGVYDVPDLTKTLAAKLRDKAQVKAARIFPYQLLAAFVNADPQVPFEIRDALQDAMETATDNVQSYGFPVAVAVDVSGSMSSAITGHRQGATSKVRCIDVAGLIGAVVARKNPGSVLLPVDTSVHDADSINPRDSVATIATKLAAFGGGGTNLSAAISHLVQTKWKGGLVLMVSDNESWADPAGDDRGAFRGSATMHAFRALQKTNPSCKLVCIDLTPNTTTQAPSSADVLNIGGFSDAVFETIARFARGEKTQDDQGSASEWVREVKAIDVATFGFKPPKAAEDDTVGE